MISRTPLSGKAEKPVPKVIKWCDSSHITYLQRQSYSDGERISGCQGLGVRVEGWGVTEGQKRAAGMLKQSSTLTVLVDRDCTCVCAIARSCTQARVKRSLRRAGLCEQLGAAAYARSETPDLRGRLGKARKGSYCFTTACKSSIQ